MKKAITLILTLVVLTLHYGVTAQTKPIINFYSKEGSGYGLVTSDSTFSLNFQFRIQNRAAFVSKSYNNLSPESFELRVRRLRLKFEGFAYHPKLTYYIQLSFSRGDQDWRGPENSNINNGPNLVRDAVIYYDPTPKWRFGFGQIKLPGNRQRVVSSGELQFADRSIVNATFNIDRDFGFFANYTSTHINLRGALTSGEGRNSLGSNNGLSYTGRVELLPFGKFTGRNDYIEGDLEREKTPKLSIGATFSYNDNAMRQAGQLGNDLYSNPDIRNYEIDVLLKYNGWAFYNEFMARNSETPVTVNTTDSNIRFIYVGDGFMSQLSYLFHNNFELAGRYSVIKPMKPLYNNEVFTNINEKEIEQIEVGVTKYLNGHRVKVQGNILYNTQTDLRSKRYSDGYWSAIFQVELGI